MSIGSTIGGLIGKKKRKKLRKRIGAEQANLFKMETLRSDFGTRQEKLQQLREARIRRAQIIAGGVNAGAGISSSAIQGGAGSAYSLGLGNIAALNVFQGYSQAIGQSQANLQILGAKMEAQQQKEQMWGGIIDTGIQVASMFAGGGMGGMGQAAGRSAGMSASNTAAANSFNYNLNWGRR